MIAQIQDPTDTTPGQVDSEEGSVRAVFVPEGNVCSIASQAHRRAADPRPCAGNRTERTATFTLDDVPPEIAITGIDGPWSRAAAVVPVITVTDPGLARADVRLDGAPFVSGTAVTAEGPHILTVDAADRAGNVSSREVTFAIDRTPPELALGGVAPFAVVRGPVALELTATDAHLASAEVTLDGEPYQPGTPVTAPGLHLARATAADLAGNRATAALDFTIDDDPPVIVLDGFEEGEITSRDVVPVATVTDANLATVAVTADGAPLPTGAAVTAEGDHLIRVEARDLAGNVSALEGRFSVDRTPPEITVSVADGATVPPATAVSFDATDAHLGTVTATLDGSPFTSGSAVIDVGAHVLVVEASDLAGNVASRTVRFTVAPPVDVLKRLLRMARILVWAGDGCRGSDVSDRLHDAVDAAAPAGAPVTHARTADEFLKLLRTGWYDVFVIGVVESGGGVVASAAAKDGAAGVGNACDRLTAGAQAELTEAVFRGAGLVVVKDAPNEDPDLKEALGAHYKGRLSGGAVQLEASGVSGPVALDVPQAVALDLEGAAAVGTLEGHPVLAAHPFGLGEAIAVAFDVGGAAPRADAVTVLGGALAFAASDPAAAPLGVLTVAIDLHASAPAQVRALERLDHWLEVVEVLDGGVSAAPAEIAWVRPLAADERATLRYLVRLPATPGSYDTVTTVEVATSGGWIEAGTANLALEVQEDAAALQASAVALATALPDRGAVKAVRRAVLARLADVARNPGRTEADRERAIADLLDAVDRVRELKDPDPTALRYGLDRLLGYWEALSR